jgi:hypothetical protein
MYVLLQSATPEYDPLLDLTESTNREYAESHGMKYYRAQGPIMSQWLPNWDPVFLTLALMEANRDIKGIFWMDADALAVGRDSVVEALWNTDLAMCRHAGPPEHWNYGVCWTRNTEQVRHFLRTVIARGPGVWPWYNEQIMNDLLAGPLFAGLITRMHDRWNSTREFTEVTDPVVVAWHNGRGMANKLYQMRWYMGVA